jgi:hypothetical protein
MTAKPIRVKGLEAYELISPNKKSQVVLLKYGAHICSYRFDCLFLVADVVSCISISRNTPIHTVLTDVKYCSYRKKRCFNPNTQRRSAECAADCFSSLIDVFQQGVPVIFPQFGPRGRLDAHGFARTAMWTVASLEQHHPSSEATVVMTLKSHESFHVWVRTKRVCVCE